MFQCDFRQETGLLDLFIYSGEQIKPEPPTAPVERPTFLGLLETRTQRWLEAAALLDASQSGQCGPFCCVSLCRHPYLSGPQPPIHVLEGRRLGSKASCGVDSTGPEPAATRQGFLTSKSCGLAQPQTHTDLQVAGHTPPPSRSPPRLGRVALAPHPCTAPLSPGPRPHYSKSPPSGSPGQAPSCPPGRGKPAGGSDANVSVAVIAIPARTSAPTPPAPKGPAPSGFFHPPWSRLILARQVPTCP